ncbi:ABC transporter substrate-binding protein [Pseudactinotalea sp. Z1732]|uniref:ABC transporter substrate-binding protein n=1 Tax=Pseudactinotalea sp. Z1732 TaxID=3413026 RepID=UPI003C7E6506
MPTLPRPVRGRPALTAVSLAVVLTIAACTTEPEDGAGPDPATPEDAAGGGTLIYATGDAEPTCLDPHVGGNYPQALISTQYLEPLLGRDADGTILPWLATDWEVSDDGLTWDFTLAEGVTFTDDTPFDAEAVRINVEHVQDPDTASSTGYLAMEKVERVEAVDDHHARFHLAEPDSALLESLTQPWNAMQSPAGIDRGMDANCAAPVGTGPFVVQEWVPQQHVTLVRNPDYTSGVPRAENDGVAHLDQITWRFIPDPATRYAALQSGEVHVIDNPEPEAIAGAGEDIEYIDAPRPGSVNRLELNGGQAPFDDERVREAFIRAADVGPGIDTLYAGVAEQAFSPLSSIEPYAYADESLFSTDPQAAERLLDEAGWSEFDDDGYRVRDGRRLSVRIPVSTNQSVAAEQSLLEQVQANTRAVGFEVILNPVDLSTWYGDLAAHDYEAVTAPYTKVGPDVLRILYHSDSLVPAPSGYFANLAQVDDPELDALLERAVATDDETEREELYTQAQARVLEGFHILPLYDQQNHFLVNGASGVWTLDTVATPTFIDARLD